MPAATSKWITGLTPEMPITSAIEVIVRARFAAVSERLEEGLDGGDDIDSVHQLRVTSRRCVAALDVLREWLPKKPRRKLAQHLGRVRRRCGKARDADVQTKFLNELIDQPGRDPDQLAGLNRLREGWSRRRRKARKKIRRKLPALANRIQLTGQKLLESLSSIARKHSSSPDQPSLADVTRVILSAQLAAVRDQSRPEPKPPEQDQLSPENLHRLRIACKRLRYVLELFFPVLPIAWQANVHPQLKQLQELLGVIQDGIVGSRQFVREANHLQKRIIRHASHSEAGTVDPNRLAQQAVSLVQAEYAARTERARNEFVGLWKCFSEGLPTL